MGKKIETLKSSQRSHKTTLKSDKPISKTLNSKKKISKNPELVKKYNDIRAYTVRMCENLEIEDFVLQPITDASPPRWHLGHTSWFFETFILTPNIKGFSVYHPLYSFFFNSYYNAVGTRTKRNERGLLSRPTVKEVLNYR